MASKHFTEATTEYWQTIEDHDHIAPQAPWKFKYSAVLPNDSILYLPIRPLRTASPDEPPKEAVASLLISQASFGVAQILAEMLTSLVKWKYGDEIDVAIGLPTGGLCLTGKIARELGHSRYVGLEYSRKFWYTDELSTELSSITSPDIVKKVYLDPNQLSLIKGRKVLIVDDAVSSGNTLSAIWSFLESPSVGCKVTSVGVAMRQGSRWKELLGEEKAEKVIRVFDSPLLKAVEGGWDVRA